MYAQLGKKCNIQENTTIGLKYKKNCDKTIIGNNATIRQGSIIYAGCKIGKDFTTGHNVLIREKTEIGDMVLVGTNTVIDGNVKMGDYIKLETNVYIPTYTKIGSYVFMGPGVTLTNDKYPLRGKYEPEAVIIEDYVSIGAQATILPGVKINQGAFIASGAVVTKDVPEWSLAVGVPAEIKTLPEKLKQKNKAENW